LDRDKTKQGVTIEEEVLSKWETLKGILLSLNSVLGAEGFPLPQLAAAAGGHHLSHPRRQDGNHHSAGGQH
jgi:hypothetical protein